MPSPTPPAPSKAPKKKPTPEQVLALFHSNLQAVRAWYGAEKSPGREIGHIMLLELALADVGTALEYAMRGENWVHPNAPAKPTGA
jgi:hypothetical protein